MPQSLTGTLAMRRLQRSRPASVLGLELWQAPQCLKMQMIVRSTQTKICQSSVQFAALTANLKADL